jgi:hypothetical protein
MVRRRPHFCRWLQSEGEADQDATAGIRTPAPGDPETPVLSDADLRALLAICAGTNFTARRDTAIILLFLDGGLRLSELAGLQVTDVDLPDRIVYVAGKASRRSGPRHRAVPLGVKAARALDRYLRERRRHPYADTLRLWLGSRGRPTLDADGVKAMLKRRSADGCITNLHPACLPPHLGPGLPGRRRQRGRPDAVGRPPTADIQTAASRPATAGDPRTAGGSARDDADQQPTAGQPLRVQAVSSPASAKAATYSSWVNSRS